MTKTENPHTPLVFYASPPHPCGYLPGREAVTVFVDPDAPMSIALYSRLTDYGFRRSGTHIYTPRCPSCEACRPARVDVSTFRPNRTQRRAATINQDLSVGTTPAVFHAEHFELYRRYMASRHEGSGMDDPDPQRYLEFITSPWADTRLVEFRCHNTLLAVAVIDYLVQGLSAVYTFYDPTEDQRSLGTYAVLWQIQQAQQLGLRWVYLGYWIKDCRKMRYKIDYRPIALRRDGAWHTYPSGVEIPA